MKFTRKFLGGFITYEDSDSWCSSDSLLGSIFKLIVGVIYGTIIGVLFILAVCGLAYLCLKGLGYLIG